MGKQQAMRREYLISITTKDAGRRIQMRNALWRLGAKEIWAGFYWVALSEQERLNLARRFAELRIGRA